MRNFSLFILVPIALFVVGVISSLAFNTISFTTLTYSERFTPNFSNPRYSLNGGESVSGEFVAKENNLGILEVKFSKKSSARFYGNEKLQFRIKEKNSKDWMHESTLLIGSYKDTWTMPIGLPIIKDSKNRQYVFEIISPKANGEIQLAIAGFEPNYKSVYKNSFGDLIRSPELMISFIAKKTLQSFADLDFLVSSSIYFSPFILYSLALVLKRQVGIKKSIPYVVILLIITDIFFISRLYPGLAFVLLVCWVVALKFNRLESSVSIFLAFILSIVLVLLIILGQQILQGVVGFYIYGLLCIGITQVILELRSKKNGQVGYQQFILRMIKRNG